MNSILFVQFRSWNGKSYNCAPFLLLSIDFNIKLRLKCDFFRIPRNIFNIFELFL